MPFANVSGCYSVTCSRKGFGKFPIPKNGEISQHFPFPNPLPIDHQYTTGKITETKIKKMGLEIVEPNTCVRGCCSSTSIPLHLPPPSFSLLSPIARGSESVVYEAILDGKRVAAKKPILSTSDDLDKFHKELQLLCKLHHPGIATLLAAHAKPPNYVFFFEFYEQSNLAHKLHVQEWSPGPDQALLITLQLGISTLSST